MRGTWTVASTTRSEGPSNIIATRLTPNRSRSNSVCPGWRVCPARCQAALLIGPVTMPSMRPGDPGSSLAASIASQTQRWLSPPPSFVGACSNRAGVREPFDASPSESMRSTRCDPAEAINGDPRSTRHQ
jgi:hypothetical protein